MEAPSNVSLIKRDTLFYFIFSLTPANQNNQNLWICLKTHSLCPDCAGQNSHPCDHIHFSLEGRVHQKEKEGSHTNSATSTLHINIGNRRNVNQSKLILVCGEYIQAWLKSAAKESNCWNGIHQEQHFSGLVTRNLNEQIRVHKKLLTDKTFPHLCWELALLNLHGSAVLHDGGELTSFSAHLVPPFCFCIYSVISHLLVWVHFHLAGYCVFHTQVQINKQTNLKKPK